MALWERYDQTSTLTTVGSHFNTEILYNSEDTDNFQNADLVLVDGIVTIITDTDDLCGVRFVLLPDVVASGSISMDDPDPDSRQVWYSFFCARGPLVFRLKSKKTLFPQHKLWMTVWKARGTASTVINTGEQFLMQLKH